MALTTTRTTAFLRRHVLHPRAQDADVILDVLKVRAPTALSGAGAVVPGDVTLFTSTGAGNALTLADGTYPGQQTIVTHVVKGTSGTGVLTPTHFRHTSVTFTNANDAVRLMWSGTQWEIIGIDGATVTG